MTEVAAGWYPDPAGGAAHRWWDGARWTDSTYQGGAPTPAPGNYQPATHEQNAYQPNAHQPNSYDQNPWQQAPYPPSGYTQHPGYPAAGFGPGSAQYGQPIGSQPGTTPANLLQRNRYTAITVAIALVYVLVAVAAHFVFIGVLPILFSVRAFRARERLAPVSAVVAGLAIIFAIVMMAG